MCELRYACWRFWLQLERREYKRCPTTKMNEGKVVTYYVILHLHCVPIKVTPCRFLNSMQ